MVKLEVWREKAREDVEHARRVLQSNQDGHAHDLKEELFGAAHDLKLLQRDEETVQADRAVLEDREKESEGTQSRAGASPVGRSPFAASKRGMKEFETLPPAEEHHRFFQTGESWVHRQALAARATSPRWKARLLRELQMWKSQLPDQSKGRRNQFEDPATRPGIPDSYFEGTVRLATPIADRFILFCKMPPPPHAACTKIETVLSTPEMQTIKATFAREPQGFFHAFILAFKQHALREQDDVWAGSVTTVAKGTCERPTYTSLRERWAGEGLCYDSVEDMKMLSSPVRPEETWYLAAERENHPYPIKILQQKPDRKLVESWPLLRTATLAMVEALLQIIEVIDVPEHAWLIDQGALGDAMYYVVSGRLRERYLNGGAEEAGRELQHGDSVGEECLLEFDRENPATVECVEPAILYRVRRAAFKAILPRFAGWYERLFALSYKRLPEHQRRLRPGGDLPSGAKDHGLPLRWPQMAGSMYQEVHSRTLRAGSRATTSDGPGRQLEENRKALAGLASSWEGGGLELATAASTRNEVQKGQGADWWKDRDPDLGTMGRIGQAVTSAEKIEAVHARASALAWRKDALRMAGQAVLQAIK